MKMQIGIGAGLCMLLAGCLTDPADPGTEPTSGDVTLTGFSSSLTATPSQDALISGQAAATKGLDSLIIQEKGPSGVLLATGTVSVTGKTSFAVKDYPFSVPTPACNGAYSAVIMAYSGSKSATHTITINVSGGVTCSDGVNPDPVADNVSVTENLTLGAQKNALGSSINLDAPLVMKADVAAQNASKVDLVYLNSFATDTDKLGSPDWAKDNVTFMDGWSTYNKTRIHKVTGTTFAAVKTRAQLLALWNQAQSTTTGIDVKPGDLVIALTEQGAYALLEITSQVAGDAGNIKIKVAK